MKFRTFFAGLFMSAAVGGTAVAAPDFSYIYANPYDASAQTYIHSMSNITLYTESTVRAWIPIVGGAT